MEVAWLRREAAQLQLQLSDMALQQLQRYAQLLQEWNQSLNLTSVVDTPSIYEVHFLDSLSVLLALETDAVENLIDVGTGAGFPGLVLAIALPQLRVTLLESIAKKARFLEELVRELGLQERVVVVNQRAETAGQQPQWRERYQVAVARAVAQLVVLGEYCLPLVQVGGCFIAQKGPNLQAELVEAKACFTALGGNQGRTYNWNLPSGAERTLVRVDKLAPTPSRYPRRPGVPLKRPLL